jgi:hypothetical protein
MTDADRVKLLHGPYRTPRFRLGRVVMDEVRGEVVVCGLTDARIPWPVGKRGRARSLVVCGGLVKALQRESGQAVAYWWGITPHTVSRWRRSLGVGPLTEGTRRLFRQHYAEVVTPEVFAKAVRAANTPEANAKKAEADQGRPLSPRARKAFDRRGRTHTAAARAKMSVAQKARGHLPPGCKGPAWTPEEDELVRTLSPDEAARRTGRSLFGVYCRRYRLKRLTPS